MNYIDAIRAALVAVRANMLRSVLTALGIIIGVGAVIVMIAVGAGAQRRVDDYIKSLGSNLVLILPGSAFFGGAHGGSGTRNKLTEDDAVTIARDISGVQASAPLVRGSVQVIYGNKNWATTAFGVTPDFETAREWEAATGRWFADRELRAAAKVALIGDTVARQVFEGGNPLGQTIRIQRVPFEVIGVLSPKGQTLFGQDQDDVIVMPITTAKNRVVGGRQISGRLVQSMYVKIRSADEVDATIQDITALLRQRHKIRSGKEDDFSVRNLSSIMEARANSSRVMSLLLAAVASISLIVGGIGIMNIMLVSVTERTREIGLRMAVGARRKDILAQFLIEAVTLSLIGGAIGVAVGIGASFGVAHLGEWPTVISPVSIVLAFTFAAATGVFFGFYPARKAARLDPIEALRYE